MQKKSSIYLFLGDDWLSKQRKISWIKNETLNSRLSEFNIDSFYPDEISDHTLKDALYTLSAKDNKRFVVIKNIEKLSPRQKQLILDYLKKPNPSCILILDSQAISVEEEPFLKEISSVANTINLRKVQRKENVFDLCRAMLQKNPASSLRILSNLLSSGQVPLKILGGISWYWTNKNITKNDYSLRRDIDLLLDTDVNIKTGKVNPDFALEFLVINLASRPVV
jgi:DNA polymerase III delta subunit